LLGRGSEQANRGPQRVDERGTRRTPFGMIDYLLARASVQIIIQKIGRQILDIVTIGIAAPALEYVEESCRFLRSLYWPQVMIIG